MKPYTYSLEMNSAVGARSAVGTSAIAQPEIAKAVADMLASVCTGLTVFVSTALIASGFTDWPMARVARLSSGIAGLALLCKTALMSKPLLFWLEVLTDRDLDLDGFVGEPETGLPAYVEPSNSWAEDAYSAAIRLWDYTHSQIRGAVSDGRKLRVKPWARRRAHGLNQEDWQKAMSVWVAGGLVKTTDARALETESYRRGLDTIESGMAGLNFMRRNGGWMPKDPPLLS
jgi:hypothetical protein